MIKNENEKTKFVNEFWHHWLVVVFVSICLQGSNWIGTHKRKKINVKKISEMEKWFEIVRYEYSDPAGTLNFWVKPKTEYEDYIDRVQSNQIAHEVKLADLENNTAILGMT